MIKKTVVYDGFVFYADAPIIWTNRQGEQIWVTALDAVRMQQAIDSKQKRDAARDKRS